MIDVPSVRDINRIADWIELYVLSEGKSISKSKILSILENNSADVGEEDIDSAISELNRRLYLYGVVKPYEINGNIITRTFDWKKYPEHTLCVYYSTFGAGNPDRGTKLFEQITKLYLEKELNYKSALFGFPIGSSFKTQLDSFANEIRENRYDNPNPHDKDRGVDIIAWKEFDNIRPNVILLFIQCAAGKHWNEKKQISLDSFRSFFSYTREATIKSLAITQIIDISDWRNATADYGLVIDRARLFRMITSPKNKTTVKLKNQIIDWCKTKLRK